MSHRHRLPIVLALMLLIAGCGAASQERQTGRLNGSVKLENVPFSEGRVSLYSPETGSAAEISLDESGQFSLGNVLIVGDYNVSITPLPLPPPIPGQPRVKQVSNIPKKYTSPATSDLKIKIGSGANTLEINMTK